MLLHYFQGSEESHSLGTFCLHSSLCLDFMSMVKNVFLVIKGKIKAVTSSYEFMSSLCSCGKECAEILHGPAVTSWYSVLVPG